jgi:hypothetical protein
MKTLAASVVILAGSIIFASGIVSHPANSDGGILCGIVVGLIGFGLLLNSWKNSGGPQS